jgi:hypothetical protein
MLHLTKRAQMKLAYLINQRHAYNTRLMRDQQTTTLPCFPLMYAFSQLRSKNMLKREKHFSQFTVRLSLIRLLP